MAERDESTREGHAPFGLVVMGVSGSGKSTVGVALAARLGCAFIEGDALHSPENVARMRAGRPLDDGSRAPWLAKVAHALDAAVRCDDVAVASCSALKRRYRDTLRAAVDAPLRFIWLDADPEELVRRIAGRPGHYMPVSLLQSQIADLEPPGNGERWLKLTNHARPEDAVAAVIDWLELGEATEATPT